jgi:L-fuculose-phosphate aldolase
VRRSDERSMSQKLVKYGRFLVSEGFVQGTWGNLSVRLSPAYMMITPSGRDYNRLEASDMVKVDLATLTHSEGKTPSSEKALHAGIYQARDDVGAIIHTHSRYCSVFAAARKPLQIETPELMEVAGELIYIADYAASGSDKLTKNVLKALGGRAGCILSNHGMIACGEDLEKAFRICEAMEKAAEEYIESRMKRLEDKRTL